MALELGCGDHHPCPGLAQHDSLVRQCRGADLSASPGAGILLIITGGGCNTTWPWEASICLGWGSRPMGRGDAWLNFYSPPMGMVLPSSVWHRRGTQLWSQSRSSGPLGANKSLYCPLSVSMPEER